jgi:hypothetical protein
MNKKKCYTKVTSPIKGNLRFPLLLPVMDPPHLPDFPLREMGDGKWGSRLEG